MKLAIPMTIEELDRLPDDGNRYELIDGVLYASAAPRIKHQRIISRLIGWMEPFATKNQLGIVLPAPTDVTPDPGSHTRVQPDVLFIRRERAHIIDEKGIYGAPDLVIEVASESSFRADLGDKCDLYRRMGVQEYWFLEPDDKYVLVFRFAESPDPKKLVPGDTLTTPLLPGLEIPVRDLFAEYL